MGLPGGGGKEFAVDAAEAAVAHDEQDVAGVDASLHWAYLAANQGYTPVIRELQEWPAK